MLEHIADLVSKDAVVGIRDIRDESSKEGIRVVIEVKTNADPHAVLNQLYASSRLQESYSANMMAIVDGRPVLMTLPHMLHVHVAHREQVIERRAAHELEKPGPGPTSLRAWCWRSSASTTWWPPARPAAAVTTSSRFSVVRKPLRDRCVLLFRGAGQVHR